MGIQGEGGETTNVFTPGGSGGGGGGASYTEFDDYANMPTGLADGANAVFTPLGRAYKFSSTYGICVPPEVYNGSPNKLLTVVGNDATPDGTSSFGSGTIETDGTWLRIAATYGNLCGFVFADAVNIVNGANFYMACWARMNAQVDGSAANNKNAFGINLTDQRICFILARSQSQEYPMFIGNSNSQVGGQVFEGHDFNVGDDGTAGYLELIVEGEGVGSKRATALVNGKIVAEAGYALTSHFADDGGTFQNSFSVGDQTTQAATDMSIRNLNFGIW